MAAAHVAACAALLRQVAPGLSPARTASVLLSCCRDLGSAGKDADYGAGLVDMRNLLSDCTHSMVFHAKKAATCTTTGRAAYYKCSICGGFFLDEAGLAPISSDRLKIKAKGHRYKAAKVLKKATFTTDGTLKKVCCRDGCNASVTQTICRLKSIAPEKASFLYNGCSRRPGILLKNRKGKIIPEKYYSVSYSNNIRPGTASIRVTFTGRYKGSKTLTFRIRKSKQLTYQVKQNSSRLNRKLQLTRKSTAVRLCWGKVSQADGYLIYAASGSSSLKRVKNITSGLCRCNILSGLSDGSRVKARVVAYRLVKGKKIAVGNSRLIRC